MEEKNLLRRRFKEIRAAVGDKKQEYSQEICEKAAELSAFHSADTVLLYYAKGNEADLSLLFEKCFSMGKTVGFPRCIDRERMVFQRVKDLSELSVGYFGISEPPADAPPCSLENAICFVPALAFDKDGYRLGYGGGYYDRFLSGFRGTTVGVTFEACLTDRLVREEFDMKTDYIITESQVKKTIES
ncbi:MAG: 5-formyltetrahydrofolate cyclo-ligase [Clostridia bacterium]|nr:5-formyltetrahydrofolate cyclo-ligase [Clostridia bacterium]